MISIALIGLSLLSSNSGSASERWIPPNIKVIEQRILTDDAKLAFYEANGMPINETLMKFAGRKSGSVFDWFNTPELEEFILWHKENGKSVYLKYLLSDPVKLFFDPIKKMRFMANALPIFYYSPEGFENIFPPGLNQILFFEYLNLRTFLVILILLLLGLGVFVHEKKQRFVTPLVMSLLIYPHALIVWTASGGDVDRHSYQLRVQFRLTIILLSIFILGYLIEWVVKNYYWSLERGKKIVMLSGIGLTAFSLSSDFLIETGDTFSLGYAQIFLLVVGFLLLVTSSYLHFAPEKLRSALLGDN